MQRLGRIPLMMRAAATVLSVVLLAGCAVHTRTAPEPGSDDTVGADGSNVWYVPGRALVCAGAGLLSVVTLTVTFGQEYETASEIMHGGCSGPWFSSPQEIRDAGVAR